MMPSQSCNTAMHIKSVRNAAAAVQVATGDQRPKTHLQKQLRPFKIERYFAKHEFTTPYLLCCSDCQPLSLADVVRDADPDCRNRWEQLSLGYTEASGDPALREEISKIYSNVSCTQIAVLAPEEGIYLTLKALLNPGDHVVVTYPGYQSLYEVARSIGCTTSYWQPQRQAQGHWSFAPKDLRSIMQSDTKAVIVNFPHNPTGALLSQAQWQEVCACCDTQGAHLFSDEMYRGLEHDASAQLPAAVDSYQRGISLCGMSKAFSMPGLRIGWVAMHEKELLQRIVQLKDYTTICSSAPSEVLALMGLRNQNTILARNHRLIQQNLALLREFFQRHVDQFEWAEPAGSSVAFPRLISGEKVDHFCARCVSEAGVLLLPGSQFADSSEDSFTTSFRVGYGRENMGECLEKLDLYLSSCQEI